MEPSDGFVVVGHGAFSLQNVDFHARLVVTCRGEGLRLLRGDGGVGLDELGEHATHGLNAQGKRGHIQKQHIFHIACEDATLDGSTHGDDFVWVDPLGGLFAEVRLDGILNGRNSRRASHDDDFIDVTLLQSCGFQCSSARLDGALHQVVHQLLKLGACQAADKVLGHSVHRHDVREVDFRTRCAGQFNLGLLSRLLQSLKGHGVFAQVQPAVFALELVHEPFDDGLVEVVSAQVGVSIGGQHFKDAISKLEDADVVGSSTKVKNHNFLVGGFFVHAVSKGCGGGLVDDALDLETGDFACFFGGLTLAVVEIRRHGDHCASDFLAQVLFCRTLHLLKHHGRNFLWGVFAVVDGHAWGVVVSFDHVVGHPAGFLLDFTEGGSHEAFDA